MAEGGWWTGGSDDLHVAGTDEAESVSAHNGGAKSTHDDR
jgi:hypothetical protein